MTRSLIERSLVVALVAFVGGCGDSDSGPADACAPTPLDAALPDASGDASHPIADSAANDASDGGAGDAPATIDADATMTDDSALGDAADAARDGSDAACTASLDSDPHNCGVCGHDCLGGACAAGQCQPMLLATAPTPYATVVDDTRVYWASSDGDPGQILSVAKDGTDPRVVADDVHNCHTLLLQGTSSILWAENTTPGRVFLANRDGSNALLLTQVGSNGPASMVADDTSLYVLDIWDTANLFQVPLAGEPDAGPPNVLTSGMTYPLGLATDGTKLYWTVQGDANGELGSSGPFDGGVHGSIMSMPKDGSSAPSIVAGDLGQPLFVAVDGSGVYWTDTLTQSVMRLPAGSTVPVALATAIDHPYALTLDGNNLYFSSVGVNGAIQRVPKDGSAAPVVLVQNLIWPTQIAIDANALYWGNTHSNTVMKLAK